MTTEIVLAQIAFDGKAHINLHAHPGEDGEWDWHTHYVPIEERDDHDEDVVAGYQDAQQMYWDSLG